MQFKTKSTAILLLFCILASLLPGTVSASEIARSGGAALPPEERFQQNQLPKNEKETYSVPERQALLSAQDAFLSDALISKKDAVESGYVRRVPEDEKNNCTLVYENADGVRTMYVYDFPVKYTDASGAAFDKSTKMTAQTVAGKTVYRPQSNDVCTSFGEKLTDGIRLSYEALDITLLPSFPLSPTLFQSPSVLFQKALGEMHADKDIQRRSPVASLSEDARTVSYILDSDTRLEYQITYTGFKEDIIVERYTGQTEYYFTLKTNGLQLYRDENEGFYALRDAAGIMKARLGEIIVFTADERNNTFGEMTFETLVQNQEYRLTIRLDSAYLSDKNTAYPLRIDPTIEVCFDKDGAGAIEDVTINSEDTSGGFAGSVSVGKRVYGISRILMRFPHLDLSTVQSYDDILSATVELRDLCVESGGAMEIACYPYTGNSWSESSVGWSETGGGVHYYLPCDTKTGSALHTKTFASYNRASNKPSLKIEYSVGFYTLPNGAYYLSNSVYGQYLSSQPGLQSGSAATLASNITWQIKNVSEEFCVIKPASSNDALCLSDNGVSVTPVYYETPEDRIYYSNSLWETSLIRGAGVQYRNSATGRVLYAEGSNLKLGDADQLADINTSGWSTVKCSDLIDLQSFIVTNMQIDIGESQTPSVTVTPANALWRELKNFTFSSSSNLISIDNSTHKITGLRSGLAQVTALHKVSGKIFVFTVRVNKKAIIILPGIMGSQIFADGDIAVSSPIAGVPADIISGGTRLWDPSADLFELPSVTKKIRGLAVNEYGIPLYSTKTNVPIVNRYNDNNIQYGAQDIYRELYNKLYLSFHAQNYDIVLYEYDWRENPYITALQLNDYIESKYDKVTFVSHSMGGIVSSFYISFGASQRSRIEKHVSVGTPYLGCAKMADIFISGKALDGFINQIITSSVIKDIVKNLPSIYALFPYEQNFQPYAGYCTGLFTEFWESYEETITIFSNYMPGWRSNLMLLAQTQNASLFLPSGKHVTTLVDSYYIIGKNTETIQSVSFILTQSGLTEPSYKTDKQGDGTVSLHSATAGGALSSERIIYVDAEAGNAASHVGMITGEVSNGDPLDFSVLNHIIACLGAPSSDE